MKEEIENLKEKDNKNKQEIEKINFLQDELKKKEFELDNEKNIWNKTIWKLQKNLDENKQQVLKLQDEITILRNNINNDNDKSEYTKK